MSCCFGIGVQKNITPVDPIIIKPNNTNKPDDEQDNKKKSAKIKTPKQIEVKQVKSQSQSESQPPSSSSLLSRNEGHMIDETTGILFAMPTENKDENFFSVVKKGDYIKCKEMIQRGHVNLNERGMWGSTPLIVACQYGRSELAKLILDHSDIDSKSKDNKVDIDAYNERNQSAILFSAMEGLTEILEILIDLGSEIINDTKEVRVYNPVLDRSIYLNPLGAAILNGHAGCVDRLLRAGNDINITFKGTGVELGETPIILAVKSAQSGAASGHASSSSSSSGSVNNNKNHNDNNDNQQIKTEKVRAELVRVLLLHGASVHSQDSTGESALSIAEKSGQQALTKMLKDWAEMESKFRDTGSVDDDEEEDIDDTLSDGEESQLRHALRVGDSTF